MEDILGTPRLRQTHITEAGYPVFERVRAEHERQGSPEYRGLDAGGRKKLRLVLALVGVLGAAGAGKYVYDRLSDESASETSEVTVPYESVPQEQSETIASESQRYERAVAGYLTRFTAPYDAVVFVDENGEPVGEPVRYQEFIGPLPPGQKPVPGQKQEHIYTPSAAFDPNIGFPLDGISSQWANYVHQHILPEGLRERIVDYVNVNPEFADIFQDETLTDLMERIRSGEIRTYDEVVAYFIAQPFPHSNGLDRYEYAIEQVTFRDEDLILPIEGGHTVRRAVVPEAQAMFRTVLPGLIANESCYRDQISSSGARGPLQILPVEWQRVTGEPEVDTDYARQIAVWGDIISDFYDSVHDSIGEERLAVLRSRFVSEAVFQTELMVRLTLNAYNAGPRRIAEVVRGYVDSVQPDDMPPGADLFQAISEFGQLAKNDTHSGKYLDLYDTEAANYVQKSEAAARVLNKRYQK